MKTPTRSRKSVEAIVEPVSALIARAGDHDVELIYVNDNYSALDTYVRHLHVTVPPDGVACIHEDLADAALKMMEPNMRAELTSCADLRFSAAA